MRIHNFIRSLLILFLALGLVFTTPTKTVYAATLTVTTLSDEFDGADCPGSDCSLREALSAATTGDTIDFAVTGTITLTMGELQPGSVTISGPGSGLLTIDGNALSRVFHIISSSTVVTITGLTIQNGRVVDEDGGGILNNSGTLTLDDVILSNNHAVKNSSIFVDGGAIYNNTNGTITMTNCQIVNNSANFSGGGITSTGSLNLDHVIISGNTAIGDGAGGVGGGIDSQNGSEVTLNHVSVVDNSAMSGGGLYMTNLVTVNITNSLFYSNEADSTGGGLVLDGTSTQYTLKNVTVSGNSTSNSSGGGGGISSSGGASMSLSLEHTTIVNNTTAGSFGGGGIINQGSGTFNLKNSILTDNVATNSSDEDCSGTFTSQDYNVIGDSNELCVIGGTTAHNHTGAFAATNPLENNGGFTQTHSISSGSVATDAIPNNSNGCGITYLEDQRGIVRPEDGNGDTTTACDIGAFELDNTNPEIDSIVRTSTSPTSASSINFTVTFSESVQNVDVNDFSLTTTGVTGASITGVTPVSASVYTVSVNTGSGSGTIRLNVPNTATIKDLSNNNLSGLPFTSGEVYNINKMPTSATFDDVPMNHPYWADIEILYANGYTAGCSTSAPLLFCPETTMNRAQSAVFMVRGNFGTSYSPPAAPWTTFGDNFAPGPWAQPWAQGMFDAGLTAGCSTNPRLFCPWEEMPRFQAAVFGMRLREGINYPPPAGTGTVFADIDGSEWYAGWVEQAYLNGLLPACGSSGGTPLFCPNDLVPRGLAAYMIVRAKNLTMP